MPSLLAVDLGLRTGLALFGADGRLLWVRSHNFGTAARLRRGAYNIVNEPPELAWLFIEGGGRLADPWRKEADRRHVPVQQVSAERWRTDLLLPREQRNSRRAKQNADVLARRVMQWSGVSTAHGLRHDAAEAILVGLWAVLQVGWLEELPDDLRR